MADDADSYYEVELTPSLRLRLLDLLRGKKVTGATVKMIENQVLCAREIDMPLVVAGFDWSDLEAEAERQGCSPADVLWDRAGPHD